MEATRTGGLIAAGHYQSSLVKSRKSYRSTQRSCQEQRTPRHKPDGKESRKAAVRTAIGFVVMGLVGFFVKLVFIPINNIVVGSA